MENRLTMKVQVKFLPYKVHNIKPGKIYEVIGLDWKTYSIIDEDNEPALYSKKYFNVVDSTIPKEWIWKKFEDNTYVADPPEFSEPGFFERWHEHEESARKIYDEYLIKNNLK